MKFIFYIFITILFFISCSKNTNKNIGDNQKDTIKAPKNSFIEKKNCLEQIQGYKDRYGIIFSNYYQDEPLSFDFDNNKTIDTIAVLKSSYENGIGDCYPENSDSDFPVLLISKTINKKSKIFKIYNNVLKCNTPVYYEEIKINKSGFVISKDLIGNNGFYTKTYVSFRTNDFYVDSISAESWGWKQYKKTIQFKNKTFKLSKYKRTDIDSIRNILDKD
ncbi:hypothetical protein OIU80_04320 [Flavobacterium sp. LS1R47]|uniref:Lipoprotein n=1 Tax=Flavobacterium frigoritolerans TaxID=2987686 RepID=A0A9X3C7J6_9FLAO|nr:hypothetical protein [Flavobacterium frigoritolerans]MCV9931497.1 hypothetical protein [Flavobacterium frigoritolerans]